VRKAAKKKNLRISIKINLIFSLYPLVNTVKFDFTLLKKILQMLYHSLVIGSIVTSDLTNLFINLNILYIKRRNITYF
jgi:hypothetical protein